MSKSTYEQQQHLRYVENIPIPSTNVYVCFLPTTITQDSLHKMFGKFGKIQSIKLSKKKDGFTYSHICFETIGQAQSAIKAMDKAKIDNKKLKVNFASQVQKTINKKIGPMTKNKQELIQQKQTNQNEKDKEAKSSDRLLLQRVPQNRLNKKSKKEKKKQVKASKEVERKIKKDLPNSQKKGTKIPDKQPKVVQIQADYEIKKQVQYEKKYLQDEEITQTQWSLDFDPSELKKKPFLTFVL